METVNSALREMTQSFKTWITVRRKLYYNIWCFYLFQDPESHRKTAAEGLLDTGFLIAQANLLKEIIDHKDDRNNYNYCIV
jgi:hypothetical protein